jgi:lipid II:glycine glycyltransferase (peptidoglycan interpeptide bridge formation enzyme)
VISNNQLHSEDLGFIFTDLANEPVLQTIIHPNPLLSGIWESAKPEGVSAIPHLSHILDLEGGFEKVWEKRFRSTTRTAIRKAENSKLTVEYDVTGKFIPVYYEMFMQWAIQRGQKRHLPPWISRWTNSRREPPERYQYIAQSLGDACRVYVARLDRQPVASAIFLTYKEHAFYYRGTSVRELAGPVRANDLLQARMIEEACRIGCRYYHMGESGGVESLMRFKSGFGAEPVSFMSYSVERLPVTGVTNRLDGFVKHVERQLMTLAR